MSEKVLEPIFSRPELHPKNWGEELWITNNDKYCGKILRFKEGTEFSMHYHVQKEETWFVVEGNLIMQYYDLVNAEKKEKTLSQGDVVHLKPNVPHKLIALTQSSVFEVSTQHFDYDSYRIEKGSSQK